VASGAVSDPGGPVPLPVTSGVVLSAGGAVLVVGGAFLAAG
jgi:hypothetical protein